jgi:carbonic anhydrase/acetyltransferase-like protein (isoleucine patch superfamily)
VLRGDFGPIVVGANTSIQDNAVIHAERGTHSGSGCVVGQLAFIEDATVGDDCL